MADTSSKSSTARRSRPWVVAVVLLGLLAGLPLPAAAQPAGGPPPPVTVSAPLQKRITDYAEFTGRFVAMDHVEVRSRVGGFLNEIRFTDGQMVNKGDLLYVIDPRPYEIALASATARMEEAKAALELANRQLKRAGELRQKDFVAQSTYDERTQQTRATSAAVDTARAAVREAELNLQFTRVVAPIGGRTSAHVLSVGNLVSGAQNPTLLSTIVSLDPVNFLFDMSEAEYLAYRRASGSGQMASSSDGRDPVRLRLADETGWPREGRIDFIDNTFDRSSGTIRVRAVVPNPGAIITPGQFGRLRLPISAPYDAFLLPDAAVVTDQSRQMVMTVAEDGTVKPRPIRTGPLVDGLRVVREGLAAGDRVVISGLLRARPGGQVTPQPGTIESRAD
ncbi:MAG: efflux RND transporter periplasmic adaptor subunit [Alphaproteobacteria bacterium]